MTSFASVCYHGWHTQAAWTKRRRKVGENNGQIRFCPPPRVAHTSRLDQKKETKREKSEERKSVLTMAMLTPGPKSMSIRHKAKACICKIHQF